MCSFKVDYQAVQVVGYICIGCCGVVCRLAARPLDLFTTMALVFCQYMKIIRFYATGLSVCKLFGLFGFFHYWGFLFSLNLLSRLLIIIFLFLIMLMLLQSGRAFALTIAHLKDPELPKLAADLSLRTIEAKAPSTTQHYSRAFQKFREWSSPYNEVVFLPPDEISVALYLESLIQCGSPYSSLESARYDGINWAHNLYGFQRPAIPNWLRTCSRQLKEILRNLFLKKNPLLPLWLEIFLVGLLILMLIFLIFV